MDCFVKTSLIPGGFRTGLESSLSHSSSKVALVLVDHVRWWELADVGRSREPDASSSWYSECGRNGLFGFRFTHWTKLLPSLRPMSGLFFLEASVSYTCGSADTCQRECAGHTFRKKNPVNMPPAKKMAATRFGSRNGNFRNKALWPNNVGNCLSGCAKNPPKAGPRMLPMDHTSGMIENA